MPDMPIDTKTAKGALSTDTPVFWSSDNHPVRALLSAVFPSLPKTTGIYASRYTGGWMVPLLYMGSPPHDLESCAKW
ncbi:MAG: hypothetical protein ACYC1T_09610 [Sulfuricaulis sp.]